MKKQLYHQFQKDWGIKLPSVTQAEIHEQLFLLFSDVADFITNCRNKMMAAIMRQAEGIDHIIETLEAVIDKLLSRLLKEPDREIYSENHLLNLDAKRFQIATYMRISRGVTGTGRMQEKEQYMGIIQVIVWEV